MKHIVAGVLAVLACPTPDALAQERGFVRALGGITFGTTETSGVFSGSAGISIAPAIQITGEVGRILSVLPKDDADDLDEFVELISEEIGQDVEAEISVPALYAMGGIRLFMPSGGIRPFVEINGGVARLTFDIDVTVAGVDVSDQIRDELGEDDSMTEFLFVTGGGLAIAAGESLDVEVGYRYGRIFVDEDEASGVNVNTVYGAVSFRF